MFIAFSLCKIIIIIIFFLTVAYIVWQLKVSTDRMGKMKIGFNFCLIAGILSQLCSNFLLSSLQPSIRMVCKLLILIYCCQSNSKAKLLKEVFKLFTQTSHCGPWASGLKGSAKRPGSDAIHRNPIHPASKTSRGETPGSETSTCEMPWCRSEIARNFKT